MGFDKLVNFLVKNLNNECIDEIDSQSDIRKIIGNHIMFDINFIIYQVLIELEDEINIIIKLLLSLSLAIDKYDIIEKKIIDYFSKNFWNNNLNIKDFIFKGNNNDEIVENFLKYDITKYNEDIVISALLNKFKTPYFNCKQFYKWGLIIDEKPEDYGEYYYIATNGVFKDIDFPDDILHFRIKNSFYRKLYENSF